ncbi:MAG: tRNA pseudouridine(55) synthase TruB [Bdellovibrionota bacterium]
MKRDIDGVLLIDKPEGITSAHVVRVVKRTLNAKKVGHGGTLDPLGTGLLVLLLGRGTKLSSLFLDGEKSYSGLIRLGCATDTDDITGQIVETDAEIATRFPAQARQSVEERIHRSFTGTLSQVPPAYSALKVGGKRSYDLAREGTLVEHAPREVSISALQVEFVSANTLKYFVRCSKGTYVRSLARDIGRAIGTCGCLESLRREECGGFSVSSACELERLSLDNFHEFLVGVEEVKAIKGVGNAVGLRSLEPGNSVATD